MALNKFALTAKQQRVWSIDLLLVFCQGEPGPKGPAGAVGEPGTGLTGPKVRSAQVYSALILRSAVSKWCVLVSRGTEGRQDLLVNLG